MIRRTVGAGHWPAHRPGDVNPKQSFQSYRYRQFNGWLFRAAQWAALTILLTALPSSAAYLVLSSDTVKPGETLRVEVDEVAPNRRLQAVFRKKIFPCYVVGPASARALIGIELGAEPGPYLLEIRDVTNRASRLPILTPTSILVASRTYTIENVNFSSQKSALMAAEHRESVIIGREKKYLTQQQLWEGAFQQPVPGRMIGEFGLKRLRNGSIDAGFHKGVDIQAPAGTPVRAANAGVVLLASNFKAHGKTVMLNHGQGVMTIYLHMQKLNVQPGQKLRQGETLGWVGSTGLSTAPHLHWQVFVHGVPVDPQQWLDNEL